MIICDLCGESKDCLPKEIDGREYDICGGCWNALAQKLKGKGRKIQETVWLPPRAAKQREQEGPPLPGEPPKIWGRPPLESPDGGGAKRTADGHTAASD